MKTGNFFIIAIEEFNAFLLFEGVCSKCSFYKKRKQDWLKASSFVFVQNLGRDLNEHLAVPLGWVCFTGSGLHWSHWTNEHPMSCLASGKLPPPSLSWDLLKRLQNLSPPQISTMQQYKLKCWLLTVKKTNASQSCQVSCKIYSLSIKEGCQKKGPFREDIHRKWRF